MSEITTNYYESLEHLGASYDISKQDNFALTRLKQHKINQLNNLAHLFKWKSNDEDIIIPRNLEIKLRTHGLMGFHKSDKKFCTLGIIDFDDNNEPAHYVAIGLGTKPKSYGTVTASEVIPLFNNPLGLSDLADINFLAYSKAQNDVSRMLQLINSRLIPMVKTNSDKTAEAFLKALNDIEHGKSAAISTDIIAEIEKLDILDPNNISKMEYLTSYDEVLDKNIANRFGASLDMKNKAAEVTSIELKAYDDITTINFLTNYIPRLEFVEKMKEENYDIEVIVNPIFADEPTAEEIENPELIEEEQEEQMQEGGNENDENQNSGNLQPSDN